MKTLNGMVFALLLAGSPAIAQDQPDKPGPPTSTIDEFERAKAIERFYLRAGKPVAAEYTRRAAESARDAAEKAARPRRVYVPIIKAEPGRRDEALMMTELLIKSIERDSAFKVVGSPDEADLTIEATLKPVERAKP